MPLSRTFSSAAKTYESARDYAQTQQPLFGKVATPGTADHTRQNSEFSTLAAMY
jgi:hypothetical protein